MIWFVSIESKNSHLIRMNGGRGSFNNTKGKKTQNWLPSFRATRKCLYENLITSFIISIQQRKWEPTINVHCLEFKWPSEEKSLLKYKWEKKKEYWKRGEIVRLVLIECWREFMNSIWSRGQYILTVHLVDHVIDDRPLIL